MTKESTLQYLAGFFDGEGSITGFVPGEINKRRFVVTAAASQIDPTPLSMMEEIFGGSFGQYKNGEGKRKIYQWLVTGKKFDVFANRMVDRIYVKKEQLEIAMEIRKIQNRIKGRSYTLAEEQKASELINKLCECKKCQF